MPAPFNKEWSGGSGKHIHHKFVVVDFNGSNPAVFTGSSNLAAGGEESNGDNLIMINDPWIASMYAIEAVRLFDHYSFREHLKAATTVKPLSLWYPGKPGQSAPWWKFYYEKTDIKFRDRYLFADMPLPPGIVSVKSANWKAVAPAKPAPEKKPASKSTKKKATAKKPATRKAAGKKARK